MSLGASTQWFNRAGGNEARGCGFDPGVTAGMLANGAITSATGASPELSSASYNFAAGDVGHWVYLPAQTNIIEGYYQIASVASNKATLSAGIGTAYAGSRWGRLSTVLGCATTASPTSVTFTVNYCDADAAKITTSDLTSTASTTVTSVLTTFTPVMVGNVLRLASGTGTTLGYYTVATYVSASQVTLDRASGTYTAGVGTLGGASATWVNYSNGGSGLPTPGVTSPLAAGHRVNIRGAGTDNPGSSDYDYSAGYWTFPVGTSGAGRISWLGYNGRPRMTIDGLLCFRPEYHKFENLFGFFEASPTFTSYGLVGEGYLSLAINVRVDANGNDAQLLMMSGAYACELMNSGGGAAGTKAAFVFGGAGGSGGSASNGVFRGNYVHDVRGDGFRPDSGSAWVDDNLFVNPGRYGVNLAAGAGAAGCYLISNNSFYGGVDHVLLGDGAAVTAASVFNNLFVSPSGVSLDAAGTTTLNDKLIAVLRNNAYYPNAGTARANLSLGLGDVTLTGDPFTNAGANDFSLNNTVGAGAACRATGYPGVMPGGLTTGYLDIGAIQHTDRIGRMIYQAGIL